MVPLKHCFAQEEFTVDNALVAKEFSASVHTLCNVSVAPLVVKSRIPVGCGQFYSRNVSFGI